MASVCEAVTGQDSNVKVPYLGGCQIDIINKLLLTFAAPCQNTHLCDGATKLGVKCIIRQLGS